MRALPGVHGLYLCLIRTHANIFMLYKTVEDVVKDASNDNKMETSENQVH